MRDAAKSFCKIKEVMSQQYLLSNESKTLVQDRSWERVDLFLTEPN